MKTNPLRILVATGLVAHLVSASIGRASTITNPGVIIMLQEGNATVSWNASVTGAALVEHSPDLSGWAVISQNNTTGTFRHATGNATRGFYRVRWTPETYLFSSSLANATGIASAGGATNLTAGEFSDGAVMQAGRYVSFPAAGRINPNEGFVQFRYRPNYAAASEPDSTRILLAVGNPSNAPAMVIAESDVLSFAVRDAGWTSYGTAGEWRAPLWQAGEWVTIRAEWNTANATDAVRLFVNGQRVGGALPGGWNLLPLPAAMETIFVGAANAQGENSADGTIADLRIGGPSPGGGGDNGGGGDTGGGGGNETVFAEPTGLEGSPVVAAAGGLLGAAPQGTSEELSLLEIRNDRGWERTGEIAYSSIPLAQSANVTDVDRLWIEGPGGERVAAQFQIVSRWGSEVDDATRPARWLQIAVPASVPANGRVVYRLNRQNQALAPVADSLAATISQNGSRYDVDTGVAGFVLNPADPALLESIVFDAGDGVRRSVYASSAGAGPRLRFVNGQGNEVLCGTEQAGRVLAESFEIVESGPVKVVVAMKGHFSAADGSSLVQPAGVATPYERFGFTMTATFLRGSADVNWQFEFRNEASGAFNPPWDDENATVREVSLNFPLGAGGTVRAAGSAWEAGLQSARVAQNRGGGTPWRRSATVAVDGQTRQAAEFFDSPMVARESEGVVVGGQMPWMRFREPQALQLANGTLSFQFVGDELIVGEGKGLWNFAKLSVEASPAPGEDAAAWLEGLRRSGQGELERGLLVRAPLARVNAAELYADMGGEGVNAVKTGYLNMLNLLHTQTVGAGGQWDRALTFGSQLWPEILGNDVWWINTATSPAAHQPGMNYWQPVSTELLEFLRSGDPKWVWDFSLPQAWLQTSTVYMNIGDRTHGNRNGLAVNSGGSGEGTWHRWDNGSDDYGYNREFDLAYALRPNFPMRDRFAQAGRNLLARYSLPKSQEGNRQQYVSEISMTRLQLQHFNAMSFGAEFVPGAEGAALHDRLMDILAELAADNLQAGVLSVSDVVPTDGTAFSQQQFMVNALAYPFLHRMFLNHGEVGGTGNLLRYLTEGQRIYYELGMDKLPDGVGIAPIGDWASLIRYTLNPARTEVLQAEWLPDSDQRLDVMAFVRPHTLAILLMAEDLQQKRGGAPLGILEPAATALASEGMLANWNENLMNNPGWWKGSAQMMNSMVFSLGGLE